MIDMEQLIRNLYTKTIRSERTTEKIDQDMQEEILNLSINQKSLFISSSSENNRL